MSHKHKPQVNIEREIISVIDLCGIEGASLEEIQLYLISTKRENAPDLECIQSSLNNAVAKGLLLELDNGNYKIKSSAERAEAIAVDGNSDGKVEAKLYSEDNEVPTATKYAKENTQNVEPSLDKRAQDANRNADVKATDVGSSMTEDANLQLPDNCDKVLTKLHKLYNNDNEIKATGGYAEENAAEVQSSIVEKPQKVEPSLDKSAQDANRNADVKTTDVGSSAEEDANAQLPDDYDKVLTKLHKLYNKDNEIKATGGYAEENAAKVHRSIDENPQEVESPTDKSPQVVQRSTDNNLQNANRNVKSDKTNAGSKITKKVANVSFPDDDDDKNDAEKILKRVKKDK